MVLSVNDEVVKALKEAFASQIWSSVLLAADRPGRQLLSRPSWKDCTGLPSSPRFASEKAISVMFFLLHLLRENDSMCYHRSDEDTDVKSSRCIQCSYIRCTYETSMVWPYKPTVALSSQHMRKPSTSSFDRGVHFQVVFAIIADSFPKLGSVLT